MVGVGPDGDDSVLARISVVNQFGHCVYDKFVKPQEEVTDYRTWVSGVRPEDLENGKFSYRNAMHFVPCASSLITLFRKFQACATTYFWSF